MPSTRDKGWRGVRNRVFGGFSGVVGVDLLRDSSLGGLMGGLKWRSRWRSA